MGLEIASIKFRDRFLRRNRFQNIANEKFDAKPQKLDHATPEFIPETNKEVMSFHDRIKKLQEDNLKKSSEPAKLPTVPKPSESDNKTKKENFDRNLYPI
jgi:hypothetical protein